MDPDTAFVADTENHAIRQIDFKRRMVGGDHTVVGSGEMGTDRVGGTLPATKQALSSPWCLCWDQKKQLLFITMAGTHQIWAYARCDPLEKEFEERRVCCRGQKWQGGKQDQLVPPGGVTGVTMGNPRVPEYTRV